MARDDASIWSAPRRLIDGARHFFGTEVWRRKLADLPTGRAILYRASRILYSTARGFFEDGLMFRAAALTYFAILSIVPFLAFAFAVLKGFGSYETFRSAVVDPYIQKHFVGNPALLDAVNKVFEFVAKTDVAGLGITGLGFLTYTSISLLSTVEAVLNKLWCFQTGRGFFRRVTDYVTLVVITPMLVLIAVTFGAAAQSSSVVVFLGERLELRPVLDVMLRMTSLAGACVGMTALFLIMPNGRVRPASALLGGVVSGVLWQLALILHVDFQIGVARYNALYSGFGALPIFLLWVYTSWLTVLLGAELAASHQNEQMVRQRLRARDVDQTLKEGLAVALMVRATAAFLNGTPRPSLEDVATDVGAPPQTVQEVADALIAGGVLVTGNEGDRETFLPAKDVGSVRVGDVLAMVRHRSHGLHADPPLQFRLDVPIERVLRSLERAESEAPANITLRELALQSTRASSQGRLREGEGSTADPVH